MYEFITEETPAKVMSLLGMSLLSLGFLYGVSTANASFSGVENQIPDPIPVMAIMQTVDNVAQGYSSFVAANLISPLSDAVAYQVESAGMAFDEATDTLALYMHVESPSASVSYIQVAQAAATPRVAGAYTENSAYKESQGGILNALYSLVTN